MWIAGVAYPEGMKATAQGLLGAIMMGLGSAFGGLLGGFVYDLVDLSQMFILFGLGSAVITMLFIWHLQQQSTVM
jgi:MFS family permease